mmetsp:Transcript_26104/g.89300  ORF Transcript_26104/g.89300 Transcript_26104/m.89300 type:complete len:225 (-) Transcript_26104:374-1048(-)
MKDAAFARSAMAASSSALNPSTSCATAYSQLSPAEPKSPGSSELSVTGTPLSYSCRSGWSLSGNAFVIQLEVGQHSSVIPLAFTYSTTASSLTHCTPCPTLVAPSDSTTPVTALAPPPARSSPAWMVTPRPWRAALRYSGAYGSKGRDSSFARSTAQNDSVLDTKKSMASLAASSPSGRPTMPMRPTATLPPAAATAPSTPLRTASCTAAKVSPRSSQRTYCGW